MSDAITLITDTQDMVRRLEAMDARTAGDAWTRAQAAFKVLEAWKESIKDAFIERVETIGDLIVQTEAGERRVYAAADTTKKCVDVKATMHRILEIGGPDVLAQVLSSNAIKPGACEPVLGDEWPDHFVVDHKVKLNEGSARSRSLRTAREPIE
jgi:hypothetical protein